jgi:uncharacterized protein
VRSILAAGEGVDRPTPDGVTALMLAIDNYEFDTAKVLLEAGANPHYADWWGRTALYLAVDMNSYQPRTGPTANQAAGVSVYTRSSATTGLDIVRQLLASGVEVDPQLNMHRPGRGGNSARFTDALLTTGATPLLRAAIMHDHETMQLLLDHGADVNLPNVMGVTPLMAAGGVGVRNINFGANRSPDFEADPLIEDKVIASLEILLDAGASIDARVTDTTSRTARIARRPGGEGETALHSAAQRGWTRVVSYLIDRGADIAVRDANGQSPLDLALARVGGRVVPGSETVAEILINAGANPAEVISAR